jgi:hypothetical protein
VAPVVQEAINSVLVPLPTHLHQQTQLQQPTASLVSTRLAMVRVPAVAVAVPEVAMVEQWELAQAKPSAMADTAVRVSPRLELLQLSLQTTRLARSQFRIQTKLQQPWFLQRPM